MNQHNRSLRVGLAALACAIVFRMFAMGLPEKLLLWLIQPNTAAFFTYLETGRDVRFPSSQSVFSPDFMESPPAVPSLPDLVPAAAFSEPETLEITYAASKDPDIAALLSQPLAWDLTGPDPTVLIVHTHTTESYTKAGEDYAETALWRTLDEGYNMLSIGEQVAEILAQYGITAIQDREIHDYPSYNGSYVHARESITKYLEQYPSIQLVLDLHRDAAGDGSGQLRTLAQVDGESSAQLMIVLGTNHEQYEQNLSVALKLHTQLQYQSPGLMRPLQLRASRFNQDLCPGGLLIEVGAAGNTHAEALIAARQLALAIAALAKGTA